MSASNDGWLSADETPDGKAHMLIVVANTSGQYHVYLDGVKEATWIDKRPSHLDLWRVMVRRFGHWRRVRSTFYRIARAIPDPKEAPNYRTPKGKGYAAEVLADSPLAYYRIPEGAVIDEITTYPSTWTTGGDLSPG